MRAARCAGGLGGAGTWALFPLLCRRVLEEVAVDGGGGGGAARLLGSVCSVLDRSVWKRSNLTI